MQARGRRLPAALFAATLLAASCSAAADEASDALPPPPPIDDTIDTEASFPDDGLTRYIITPIAAPSDAGEASEADLADDGSGGGDTGTEPGTEPDAGDDGAGDAQSGTDGPDAGESVASDESTPPRVLTPELLAQVPEGAPLVREGGQIGYLDDEGRFVALSLADQTDADTSAPGPTDADPADGSDDADSDADDERDGDEVAAISYGNPYVDELAADPAVESVTVLGDGSYGVTVSDPSAIDPAVFAIAEDVPFGHTTERYERYQWGLENDGTSLRRLRALEQVEDADLDVEPTVGRADGSGVVVAVIDSGVDFSHPDLADSSWTNDDEECGNGIDDDANGYVDDCHGWDFGNGDPTSYERGNNPHGTHVAGIITGNRNRRGIAGIAPGATVMDLNVGTRGRRGESISGASITAAIRYAVDNGADVINLSLGTEPGTPAEAVAPMAAAIDHAAAQGVVVVAAAGNHGIDIGSTPIYPASFARPNMLVVGASTPADTKARFSNHGADVVDLYAPGELILSTFPRRGFRFMSGTSQAAPAVAASVALIIESNPDASVTELIDTAVASVDRKEALSTSATSGRFNSARAIGVEDESPIPTELDVAVTGLREPSNEIAATVQISTPPEPFAEPHRWELALVTSDGTNAFAVVDHPLTIDGSSLTTGESGFVELLGADGASEVGVAEVAVATELPPGQYSFVVEAVPVDDPSFRLGDAFIASFVIPGDPAESDPITTTPTTERPEATTPTSPSDDGGTDDPPDQDDGGSGSTVGSDPTTTTTAGSGGTGSSGPSTGGGTSGPGSTAPAPTESTGGTTGGSGGSGDSTDTDADDEPTGTGSDGGSGTETPATTAPGGTTPTTQPPSSGTDGGSTATTQSPSDDDPGTGSTTPATTPTTGGGSSPDSGDAAADLGSGEAKKGAWESTSVEPQTGPVGEATTVQIAGNFPSDTYVWFGEQPGQVVYQDRGLITVRTPLRAEPGVVDITLRKSRQGVVLTIPAAFAFTGDGTTDDPTDAGSGTDGDDDVAGGDDSLPGGTGDDGDSPSGGTDDDRTDEDDDDRDDDDRDDDGDDDNDDNDEGSDGSSGGDDSGGDGQEGSDGDSVDRSDRRSRMALGDPVELANGLVGRPLTPNLTAGVRTCSTDPCPAVRR